MALQKFVVAPINSGLENDRKPWMIPDDAFALLNNAYVFRGRVRKRFGSYLMNGRVAPSVQQLYSRLRVNIGTTNGAGNFAGVVPGTIFKIGQLFSVGDEIFTVYQTGAPAAMLRTVNPGVATFNTTTGAVSINGADALTDVYFYPAEPVMGLPTYETADINFEPTYGFDTQFAYYFDDVVGGWERLGTAAWTGSNAQLFWWETFRNLNAALQVEPLLFVTNFNVADGIKYYDGTTWTDYVANTADGIGNNQVLTARIVIQFKRRLLFLNTIELVNGVQQEFPNRCRYSWVGDIENATAFRTDIKGCGGLEGASTAEAIVSAEFIKDRLIVFFERSTWELVYTGNQVRPFVWQKIDTALGAESPFATVPFDKVIMGVGNVGVHACNGSNVERIDQKIPDEVFKIHNGSNSVQRVYGIRDYYSEMVYWSFPSDDNRIYPTRVLVYNYRGGSWAFNDDSIACFGYFRHKNVTTWSNNNNIWQESLMTWSSGQLNARALDIVAGNQEGFVFILGADVSRNAPSLQVTNIVGNTMTIVDHNLSAGDYINIENTGSTGIILKVLTVVDANTITISASLPGTYVGGATAALVSIIDIKTKQYNFFIDSARNSTINKAVFLLDKTSNGAVTVDYYVSTSSEPLAEMGNANNTLTGNSSLQTSAYSLYPMESTQQRVWHPIYINADGASIQLEIYLSDEQAQLIDCALCDFQMHAMVFYAQPTSSNLY